MKHLIDYAKSFLGCPYKWGGENPMGGFDCSGLVQEILRSVGIDPPGDQTAQVLYRHFEPIAIRNERGAGVLAFYGDSFIRVTHVAFMIDHWRVIEAASGSSNVHTLDDADRANAFVRIRPIDARKDLLVTLKPHYSFV